MVTICEFSRFAIVNKIKSTACAVVTAEFERIFAIIGVPEVYKTDNGPPFQSASFREFAAAQGFENRKITPHWPRANNEAE